MNIKESYNLNPKRIIKVNDGYLLQLSKVKLVLSHVSYKEWEIQCASEIINRLVSKGFTNIIIIRRNREGKPFINESNTLYILTDNAEELRFKLNSRKNGTAMAEVLAHFHNVAEGFTPPPGVKMKVRWGKKMEKCRNLTMRIEKFVDYISDKKNLSEFEAYAKPYAQELLRRAKASMKILKSMDYIKGLESSMKRKEVCINAISNNTAKLSGGRLTITKVFDIAYNMVEEDVAALIKKLIEETGDKGVYDYVLSTYCRIRNVDENSRRIIRALVSFPFDSIKTISKYMDHMDRGEELLNKLKKYMKNEYKTDILEV